MINEKAEKLNQIKIEQQNKISKLSKFLNGKPKESWLFVKI